MQQTDCSSTIRNRNCGDAPAVAGARRTHTRARVQLAPDYTAPMLLILLLNGVASATDTTVVPGGYGGRGFAGGPAVATSEAARVSPSADGASTSTIAQGRVVAKRWTQDVFGISNWVTPSIPASADWVDQLDARLAEYAAANFTVMLQSTGGNCTGTNWEACMMQQVALGEKHGLKMIPSVPTVGTINRANGSMVSYRPVSSTITNSPSFWGFDFYDEPNTNVFPALANLSRQVGAALPGKVRFINLLPNYADPATQLLSKNYTTCVCSQPLIAP
eukprot:COSAG02_NODE_9474_length_2205_cov_1.420228_3_plen_276_part_00